MSPALENDGTRPKVGLFVTCLVDLFRPAIGVAAVKLLQDAGCIVEVPVAQLCCGGTGDDPHDRRMNLRETIDTFDGCDHVVVPSGSCASILRERCATAFVDDPAWADRASALALRVHELTSFLVDVLGVSTVSARMNGSATFHDTCCGASGPRMQEQPRALLRSVEGIRLTEPGNPAGCCGLRAGGSGAAARIRDAGAGVVISGDLGCLMNMARQLKRDGSAIEVRHVAEVLAGMNDAPPIGDNASQRTAKRAG